jgi:hypothetical protein
MQPVCFSSGPPSWYTTSPTFEYMFCMYLYACLWLFEPG